MQWRTVKHGVVGGVLVVMPESRATIGRLVAVED